MSLKVLFLSMDHQHLIKTMNMMTFFKYLKIVFSN